MDSFTVFQMWTRHKSSSWTSKCYSSSLQLRAAPFSLLLGIRKVALALNYIHKVYEPVQTGSRPNCFLLLTSHSKDEAYHIVMGTSIRSFRVKCIRHARNNDHADKVCKFCPTGRQCYVLSIIDKFII